MEQVWPLDEKQDQVERFMKRREKKNKKNPYTKVSKIWHNEKEYKFTNRDLQIAMGEEE